MTTSTTLETALGSKSYYTTGEIARLLSVSTITILRAIESGHVRSSTTPGGHHRVSRSDLRDFLIQNRYLLDHGPAKILIAEDNPAELRSFERSLSRQSGWEVHGTTSGYEAGFLTKALKPDVLLLDIFLDDLDGRQVVKLIRKDPDLRGMKILAITGHKDPEVARDILSVGVDELIFKGVTPEKLRESVAQALASIGKGEPLARTAR